MHRQGAWRSSCQDQWRIQISSFRAFGTIVRFGNPCTNIRTYGKINGKHWEKSTLKRLDMDVFVERLGTIGGFSGKPCFILFHYQRVTCWVKRSADSLGFKMLAHPSHAGEQFPWIHNANSGQMPKNHWPATTRNIQKTSAQTKKATFSGLTISFEKKNYYIVTNSWCTNVDWSFGNAFKLTNKRLNIQIPARISGHVSSAWPNHLFGVKKSLFHQHTFDVSDGQNWSNPPQNKWEMSLTCQISDSASASLVNSVEKYMFAFMCRFKKRIP